MENTKTGKRIILKSKQRGMQAREYYVTSVLAVSFDLLDMVVNALLTAQLQTLEQMTY